MLVCGLIYSFTYFIAFGVNVFEFAPIDFYVRAALVGSAGLFAACAALFTAFLVWWWLRKPGLTWGSVLLGVTGAAVTLVLTFGVGSYQAWLVRDCHESKSPYKVKVTTSCEKPTSADAAARSEHPLSLVGIIGDRVILYDGQGTIALRRDDVKSIEWDGAAIQARGSWWRPQRCALSQPTAGSTPTAAEGQSEPH